MGFIRLFFHHGALIRFTLSNFAVLLHLRCTRPEIKNGKWISNDIDFWLSAIIKYISDDDTCARAKGYLKNCIVHLEKIHIDHTRHPSRNKKSYNKESSRHSH